MPKSSPRIGRAGFQPAGRRAGQALIVAVLVLFAVATLAALFAAIISSQLAQVGRHGDVVRLRNLTEAGLWLANEQLTYSMKGADWRPYSSGYRFGGGQVNISVSCGPVPGQLQSRFLRIVSTAVFPDNPFLRSTMVALKPMLLTDYALFVTDRHETNMPARLGVSGLALGRDHRDDYVLYIDGPVRSNTNLIAYGNSQLLLHTAKEVAELGSTWADLGILRDDRIEVAGDLYPDPARPVGARGGDALALLIDGISRATDLFTPATADEQEDYAAGFPDWAEEALVPNGRVLANMADYGAVAGPALAISRVQPPEIDAAHPDMQTNRYLLLTRDSGAWVGAATPYNTGEFGWGWTNFGGIYIDNFADIQYEHNLELLRRNWVASVGRHGWDVPKPGGDRRPDNDGERSAEDGPPKGPADWWDKTARYYAPPGVEIVLHGESECPYIEIIRDDDPDGDGMYWKGMDRQPTTDFPYSPAMGKCSPQGTSRPLGIDQGTAIFPFPPNGVIYAEGNVRIRGIMPPLRDSFGRMGEQIPERDARQIPYFGEWTGATGRSRRFDLQVVSGGTIYIEGDLLTPGAAGLITDTYAVDRYYGSRLALLARDYVCLNTTALNPRPKYLLEPETVGADTYLYNDRYPNYLPGEYPRYLLFQGPENDTAWDDPNPRATEPDSIEFIYHSVRLQSDQLRAQLADLRLILGHSGWYARGGIAGDPEEPPAPITGDNEASVELVLGIQDATEPAGITLYPWEFKSGSYAFWRSSVAKPEEKDESNHWYITQDHLEFLPNDYQYMVPLNYLSGHDILKFASRVTPIEHRDSYGNPDGWEVAPNDLAYLLGPVAIAPPRWVGGNTSQPADPLPVEIHAMIYAQNGSWFVIPGPWFNEDPDESALDPTAQDYPGYHEPLNIQISVYGAITENMPAGLGSAAEWTSKWSGPAGRGDMGFLSYAYDPLLRWPRWDIEGGAPRFPNLPMTSDLMIWGERISGQAGT